MLVNNKQQKCKSFNSYIHLHSKAQDLLLLLVNVLKVLKIPQKKMASFFSCNFILHAKFLEMKVRKK